MGKFIYIIYIYYSSINGELSIAKFDILNGLLGSLRMFKGEMNRETRSRDIAGRQATPTVANASPLRPGGATWATGVKIFAPSTLW